MSTEKYLCIPTLGGCQFWSDLYYYNGFRIQKSYWSKKHRLLDKWDICRATGNFDDCIKSLNYQIELHEIKDESGHIVIMIHGLGRTKGSFNKMKNEFEKSGYKTFAINYPSTRCSIKENCKYIKETLKSLKNYKTISFVTHSLGGIILRYLLQDKGDWLKDKKIGRIVMIAPPNQGSKTAQKAHQYSIINSIMGPCLKELTPENAKSFPDIDKNIDVGIIAGANDSEKGYNPLLSGDNDGILSIDETRLNGSKETTTIHATHTLITMSSNAIKSSIRFIKSGRFIKGKKPKKQEAKVEVF